MALRRVRKDDTAAVASVPARITAAIKQTQDLFKERKEAILVSWLGKLTGQNYIFVGDPGTGKTLLEKAIAMHVTGARYFKIQLHSFSTPNDVFGRYDLAALQKGEEKRRTEGKLLEADFAMFDEVLKTGEGCANAMLSVTNEREFEGKKLDLLSIGAATNWPEVDRMSPMIAAFWDRFQLRCVVSKIKDKRARMALLKARQAVKNYTPDPGTTITLDELRAAQAEIASVEISDPVYENLLGAVDRLRSEEIEISDRRVNQIAEAAQAHAWLHGRKQVGTSDLKVIGWMGWNTKKEIGKAAAIVDTIDIETARATIREISDVFGRFHSTKASLTPDTAAELMDQLIAVKERVNEAKASDMFTAKTLPDVENAEKKLTEAWLYLSSRFESVLEE